MELELFWHFHLCKIRSRWKKYTLRTKSKLLSMRMFTESQYMQLQIGVLFTTATAHRCHCFSGKWWNEKEQNLCIIIWQRQGIYASLFVGALPYSMAFGAFIWRSLALTDSTPCLAKLYFFFFLPNDHAVLSTSVSSQFLPAQCRPV